MLCDAGQPTYRLGTYVQALGYNARQQTTGGRIDPRRELSTAARALATVRAGRDPIPGM